MLRVVYDVDDTLWGLNKVVFPLIDSSLTEEDAIIYECAENPRLTSEQRRKALQLYGDPDVFSSCEFYEGVDRICDIEKNGLAETWISSSNFNEGTRDVKLIRLLHRIPDLKLHHICMTVNGDHRRVQGHILVDDRPQNVIDNDFMYYVIIRKPYNKDFNFPENKNVIMVDSLSEAITTVERIVHEEIQRSRVFAPGEIVQYFKQEMEPRGSSRYIYQFIGKATDPQGNDFAVYRQINSSQMLLKPLTEFNAFVDKDVYPAVNQMYEFEKIN